MHTEHSFWKCTSTIEWLCSFLTWNEWKKTGRFLPLFTLTTPASSSNLLLHRGFVSGRRLHVAGFLQEQHNTSVALQTFVYTSTARWRPSNRRCLNLDVQSIKHIVRQITIKQTEIFSRYNLRVQSIPHAQVWLSYPLRANLCSCGKKKYLVASLIVEWTNPQWTTVLETLNKTEWDGEGFVLTLKLLLQRCSLPTLITLIKMTVEGTHWNKLSPRRDLTDHCSTEGANKLIGEVKPR